MRKADLKSGITRTCRGCRSQSEQTYRSAQPFILTLLPITFQHDSPPALRADTHLRAAGFARFLRRLFHLHALFFLQWQFPVKETWCAWKVFIIRAQLRVLKDNSVNPLSRNQSVLMKLPGFFWDHLEHQRARTFYLQYIFHIFKQLDKKQAFDFIGCFRLKSKTCFCCTCCILFYLN